MRLPSRNRRAFTLVELLVVIGIIAVLVALLLPVLARVRYEARVTSCAARLQQFGVTIHSYAADNRGWFPSQDLPGTGRNLWDVSTDFYEILHGPYALPKEMFFCPFQTDALRDYVFDYYGYFRIIGYLLWIPHKNGGVTVPPDPGDPGFIFADPQVFRGPARLSDGQVNVAPFITDLVSTGGSGTPPAANADLSTDPTLGLSSESQHQWRPGLLESSNQAYADGHVERVLGRHVKARYNGNFWNWR